MAAGSGHKPPGKGGGRKQKVKEGGGASADQTPKSNKYADKAEQDKKEKEGGKKKS